ncbi:MAG: basic amino acid ABC transporter substrate-binding protein [Defluviitaleaceae bacterium]|nr:basic amino acid ABC transporter substrate-binding protein [Defluviitaleaceae bacterium]
MKRIIPLLLLLVAMVVLFAACGRGNDGGDAVVPEGNEGTNVTEPATEPDANEGGEQPEEVVIGRDDGILIMATSADFPPFEFVNDDGEYDGFDVHMARAIADILGKELVIQNMSFDAVIMAVTTGAADVAIAAITITDERRLSVDFTIPYFETTLVAIVQEDSDIVSIEQLTYARIAVQLGTTSDLMVEWNLPNAYVRRLLRAPDTVLELNTGGVDAIVIDRGVAEQFIHDSPGLRILEETLAYEEYAIAVNLNNPQLTADINAALEQLMASGELALIYDMFFGGDE